MHHPSSFISTDLLSTIRRYAPDAEKMGELHNQQLKIIYEQGWLNMFVPKDIGGLGLSLVEVVQAEESLSWADGSVAWVVTLCSGAAWFCGFLNAELLPDLFKDNKVCLAGSGAPDGVANIQEDGFEINGSWKYASGALHATVFTANCVIVKDGVTLYNEDGSPLIRSFAFKKDEVVLHPTWKTMGMIATGSHSFEVRNLRIPASRYFVIDPIYAVLKNAVYQYPFLQLAEVTLAANYSGMAMRFIELAEDIIMKRISFKIKGITHLSQKIEAIKSLFDTTRESFYKSLQASWHVCENGRSVPSSLLQEVSNASFNLYKKSLQSVAELYPLCGILAANTDNEINRVWRNIHTASQHALFADRM